MIIDNQFLTNVSDDESNWKKFFCKIWDGTKIFIVSGNYVRDHINTDIVEGGHGYVYKCIPKDEIWLEKLENPCDMRMNLVHEIIEYLLMKYRSLKYDHAHDIAENVESKIRKIQ